MKIHTVGELRRRAKEVKHNLPDLSVLGSHLKTGMHGGVFKYGDNVLKVGESATKERIIEMLDWLKLSHKHMARLIDFGYFGSGYWTLIEYVPLTLSVQDVECLDTVRRAAMYRRKSGWFEAQDIWGHLINASKEVKRMDAEWRSLCDFLHRAKYWHSDLSVGNVRKTHDGIVKLIDFESFGII